VTIPRSLGPALIVGGTALTQVWLFIVAPLAAAAGHLPTPVPHVHASG
jgi:hypothetical protein